MRRMQLAGVALLLGTVACRGTLSPLSNKINAGQEPFFVFVADGEDGLGDLFAAKPEGGTPFQFTFSRVDEALPALAPGGTMVAFVRTRAPGDTTPGNLVVMNLVNGAERSVQLAGNTVDALAWSADGATIYARRGEAIFTLPAPPAKGELTPVAPGDAAIADSAFRVLLGDPPLGEAVACAGGPGICAHLASGEVQPLSATGTHPTRWPGDSVAYLEDGTWIVRPLGGGTERTIRFTRPVANPRAVSAVGKPAAAPSP